MKVKNISVIILMLFTFTANAATIYVTDTININLRSAENSNSRLVKALSPGTPLTVIQKRNSGYTKVRTENGLSGYILTRYTLDHPTSSWYLDKAQKKLALLQTENDKMSAELASLQGDNDKNNSTNQTLEIERNQLKKDLLELRQTSGNAIRIKLERDDLQEQVVNIMRELEQLKLEKNALEDSSNQDWFLYGGILAFAGILFGLFIPKFSWQRKTRRWDSI